MLRLSLLAVPLLVLTVRPAQAIEPANPNLSPNAGEVLEYLHSIYGERVLSGIWERKRAEQVHEIAGVRPAILAVDISGWNSPTWGESYRSVVDDYLRDAKAWSAEGGLVTIQFHWKNPGRADGTAWVEGDEGTGSFDIGRAVTPGTDEHRQVMRDLSHTADYLDALQQSGVPVLWRPLHEIDGGWFWWTDSEAPENTAKLWRLMFDYFTRERKLNNLIWVYSAGVATAGHQEPEQIELRRRFYPGAEYVDIAGIDIYPSEWHGWPSPQEDAYQRAYDIMSQVAPGKMLALCEAEALPNPEQMAERGPKWLYALPWYAGDEHNPEEWVRETYRHPVMINREELPRFEK